MPRTHGSVALVSLGGNQLSESIASRLTRVIVETDLLAPSTCRIALSDRDASLLDDLNVEIGTEIEIHCSAVSEEQTNRVFIGSVYALEYEADERGGRSVIIGYDAGYVLRQTRATKSYNDVTDANVVRDVCDAAGVTVGTVEASDVQHPYLAQLNETAWDFLAQRAHANDCIMYVADGALQFRAAPPSSDGPDVGDRASHDPLQLAYGRNLTHLLVRQSASGLAEQIEVRGWDPVANDGVSATATPATRAARARDDPARIAADHGSPAFVVACPSLATVPECSAVAKSAAEATASAMMYAEGRAAGDPRLIAGAAVSIGVTGRFDGRYTLTTATHVFDDEGYFTEFAISGEHDRSTFGLLAGPAMGRYDGVRPAIVTNIADPNELGRVRLKFPWLSDDYESNWSRVLQIGAGTDRGLMWFPEADDEVVVSFLDGDVRHPVVLGGLYNGVNTPPLDGFSALGDGAVDIRCLRTRVGHTIEFVDREGEELVRVTTGDGSSSIVLDQAGGKLLVSTTGSVEIAADGSTTISSGGDLTIETQGSLSIQAQGSAEVNASSGLTLSSNGQVDVSGTTINLN